MGADQVGSGPLLDIGEYYRHGLEKYELRWDLPPWMPLPMAFDDLDRKTQFFVLFQEWSRREMEGMAALTGGDVDGAEQIFDECVERAQQIEVNELLARSYEDLRRVAQRRGDLTAERQWNKKAADARKR
jgi:glycogen debranching enzyme